MEVDRVPLSQLPSRYGIARSALYTRLKDLQIEPFKEGKKAYLSASQMELLDRLHSHIRNGGTTPEFLKHNQISPEPSTSNIVQVSNNRLAEPLTN